MRNGGAAYTLAAVANALKFLPVTALLAACAAPAQWSKPQAGAEQRQSDTQACEEQAYREVMKRYSAVSTVPPAVAADSQARRFNVYPGGPFADQYGTQLQEESRLVAACMREKGYVQAPATPK